MDPLDSFLAPYLASGEGIGTSYVHAGSNRSPGEFVFAGVYRFNVDPNTGFISKVADLLSSRLRFDSSAIQEGRMFDAESTPSHFLVLESHPLLGRTTEDAVLRRYPGASKIADYLLTGQYTYGLYRAAPVNVTPLGADH